eukprot:GHVQ01037445.1.p1 GENE.GHVQ01037445.1~~GHVQ01037445.1.p1  ORF type:complete len:314 (-),score=15.88 GHVQ01037445.1:175-1116(-)
MNRFLRLCRSPYRNGRVHRAAQFCCIASLSYICGSDCYHPNDIVFTGNRLNEHPSHSSPPSFYSPQSSTIMRPLSRNQSHQDSRSWLRGSVPFLGVKSQDLSVSRHIDKAQPRSTAAADSSASFISSKYQKNNSPRHLPTDATSSHFTIGQHRSDSHAESGPDVQSYILSSDPAPSSPSILQTGLRAHNRQSEKGLFDHIMRFGVQTAMGGATQNMNGPFMPPPSAAPSIPGSPVLSTYYHPHSPMKNSGLCMRCWGRGGTTTSWSGTSSRMKHLADVWPTIRELSQGWVSSWTYVWGLWVAIGAMSAMSLCC